MWPKLLNMNAHWILLYCIHSDAITTESARGGGAVLWGWNTYRSPSTNYCYDPYLRSSAMLNAFCRFLQLQQTWRPWFMTFECIRMPPVLLSNRFECDAVQKCSYNRDMAWNHWSGCGRFRDVVIITVFAILLILIDCRAIQYFFSFHLLNSKRYCVVSEKIRECVETRARLMSGHFNREDGGAGEKWKGSTSTTSSW